MNTLFSNIIFDNANMKNQLMEAISIDIPSSYKKSFKQKKIGITKKERASRIEPTLFSLNTHDNLFWYDQEDILSFNLNKIHKKTIEGQRGAQTYILGSVNSISLQNNLIYDLFEPATSKNQKVSTKCRCSQSKCIAKYCQCFSRGIGCGILCNCLNCQNKTTYDAIPVIEVQKKVCRCQKSQCNKKYCDCLRQGNKCSKECQCINCHNI